MMDRSIVLDCMMIPPGVVSSGRRDDGSQCAAETGMMLSLSIGHETSLGTGKPGETRGDDGNDHEDDDGDAAAIICLFY